MRTYLGPRIDATILGTASLLALSMGNGNDVPQHFEYTHTAGVRQAGEALVGVWRSADETVRLHLRDDLTYDRSVAGRRRVSHGTYRLDGDTVALRDDSGLRTTVSRSGDALEMAGHRLYR